MTFTDTLGVLALLVQAVSLAIVAYSVYTGFRETRRDRDLQIVLALSESFRQRWESDWRQLMRDLREAKRESGEWVVPSGYRDEMNNYLNWIDWLGVLIDNRSIYQKNSIVQPLRPQLTEAINAGRTLIERPSSKEGPNRWHGLLAVADVLGIAWAKETYRISKAA